MACAICFFFPSPFYKRHRVIFFFVFVLFILFECASLSFSLMMLEALVVWVIAICASELQKYAALSLYFMLVITLHSLHKLCFLSKWYIFMLFSLGHVEN